MKMEWEYKVLQGDNLPNDGNLNILSRDGWELVQIIDRGAIVYVYIRRRKSH